MLQSRSRLILEQTSSNHKFKGGRGFEEVGQVGVKNGAKETSEVNKHTKCNISLTTLHPTAVIPHPELFTLIINLFLNCHTTYHLS